MVGVMAVAACSSDGDRRGEAAGTEVSEPVRSDGTTGDSGPPKAACTESDKAELTESVNLPCGHCTERACRVACVQEHTGVTQDCAGCVVEQVRCIGMQCSCGGTLPFAEAKCTACIKKSGCRAAFAECSGIPFEPIGPEEPWSCSQLLNCTKSCQQDYLTCASACAAQGLPEPEPLQSFISMSQCIADKCGEGTDPICFGEALLNDCGQESKVCVGGPTCPRQCDGKACGPDGCGDVCGSCGPGKLCTASGQCEPPELACDEIGKTGQCEGEVLLVCEDPALLQVTDCALTGLVCAFDETIGRYACLAQR